MRSFQHSRRKKTEG